MYAQFADFEAHETPTLLHAMGDFVESLRGRYITLFDSGTTLEDVRTMGERTSYTAGTKTEAGDASSSTALGVLHCLRVAARAHFGRIDLEGLHVAVQGVGNVGRRLARLLRNSGARLTIADKVTTPTTNLRHRTMTAASRVPEFSTVPTTWPTPAALSTYAISAQAGLARQSSDTLPNSRTLLSR